MRIQTSTAFGLAWLDTQLSHKRIVEASSRRVWREVSPLRWMSQWRLEGLARSIRIARATKGG